MLQKKREEYPVGAEHQIQSWLTIVGNQNPRAISNTSAIPKITDF